MMAANVLERLLAIFLHIGLTAIVFYGAVKVKKAFLPLTILLHMLMDTFPALYQRGAVPLWSVEVWAAFWTVITGFIAARTSVRAGILFGRFPVPEETRCISKRIYGIILFPEQHTRDILNAVE